MKARFGIRRTGRIGVFCLLPVLSHPLEVSAQTPNADLLLLNAHVVTMNDKQPSARAIALKGDRIVWVGSADQAQWKRLVA